MRLKDVTSSFFSNYFIFLLFITNKLETCSIEITTILYQIE